MREEGLEGAQRACPDPVFRQFGSRRKSPGRALLGAGDFSPVPETMISGIRVAAAYCPPTRPGYKVCALRKKIQSRSASVSDASASRASARRPERVPSEAG